MNEQQHDMTGAWALNALDAEERALLEELLAQDPEAATEARSFEETAGELARGLEPEAPRPELKHSLMAQISRTPQHSAQATGHDDTTAHIAPAPSARTHRRVDGAPSSPAVDGPPDTSTTDDHEAAVIPLDRYRSSVRRSRWLTVAAAALMVTSVTGVGLWNSERMAQDDARATIEALQSAQSGSDQEREMISSLLTAEDTSQLAIPAEHGGTLHVMYSRNQGAMIVQGAGLPELPNDSTYQLWIVDDTARSAGLISDPGQAVMAQEEMPLTAQIGLSIEPAGGSEQPTDVIAIQEL